MRVRVWPVIVVGVLALTIGANIWVAVIASADPAFAIEENYYQRAVNYDLGRAQQRRSDRLHWQVELSAGAATPTGTTLRATLRDSAGAIVTDATVRVLLRRVARSQDARPAVLTLAGEVYSATVPVDAPGLWDVEIEARRGPSRFLAQRRLDVVGTTGS